MHLPVLPHSYVARQRLWDQLDVTTTRGGTVLVGPVGSGKTMGVAGWLRNAGLASRSTWVTCDESWTMERLNPLFDRRDPSTSGPALVVLDDSHRLTASALAGIRARLRQNADSTRVLMTSLRAPHNDWADLQLLGNLTIINGEFLRLDEEESSAIVAAHARTRSREVSSTISRLADGWCAAVVLMARALGSSADPVTAADRLAMLGNHQADRIADEAFATLSERERHVLFCVATESMVSADVASQLANDPNAGGVLARLSTIGLLVTSVTSRPDESVRFTVHPLLVAVLRRRVAAGGVDARRSAATVRRAVQLDLARGDTSEALRRLLATGSIRDAASLIASSGTTLILRGHGTAIAEFSHSFPELVGADPALWFPVAHAHWLADDIPASLALLDRVIENADRSTPADVAAARLMRSRLGLEPIEPAIEEGRAVLATLTDQALGAILTYELAVTQCWNGDLTSAEQNLNGLLQLADALDLPVLERSASSYLAINLYLQGRHDAALVYANELLARRRSEQTPVLPIIEYRCRIVTDLVASASLDRTDALANQDPDEEFVIHQADSTTRFLAHLRRGRINLAQSGVAPARSALDIPLRGPMPAHIRARLGLEGGVLAVLARDRTGMKAARDDLRDDDPAASSLIEGWLADLDGDRNSAAAAWLTAADSADSMRTRSIALTNLAQVQADLGETKAAIDWLLDALALTETPRYAIPFLGWVRHGRPIASLLSVVAASPKASWAVELSTALSGSEGILARHQIRGPAPVESPLVSLVLTSRERAVLDELARGATYADIASELVVSENTVKTHVSSLYSKLSVNRRSEALATARRLHLL